MEEYPKPLLARLTESISAKECEPPGGESLFDQRVESPRQEICAPGGTKPGTGNRLSHWPNQPNDSEDAVRRQQSLDGLGADIASEPTLKVLLLTALFILRII